MRGNNINVKDVCIFELIGKCELRVNILRVRQEPLDYEHCDSEGLTNGTSQKVNGSLTKKVKGKTRKTQSLAMIEGQKVAFSIEKVKCGIAAKGSVAGSQSRSTNGKSGINVTMIVDLIVCMWHVHCQTEYLIILVLRPLGAFQ